MAGEDEDLVVTIDQDDDAGASSAEAKGADSGGKDPAKDLADQFASLKKANEANAAARAEAERRAAQAQADAERARREADSARNEVHSSNLDTVTTALEAATAAIAAAKRDIKSAIEEGDAEKQAEAYAALSQVSATKVRLEEAKDDLEHTVKAAKEAKPKIEKAPAADPVESYIAGRTDRTQQWLREHRDYVLDAKKNAKLNAAHFAAVAEDLTPDTDAYFEHVEKFLGLKEAEAEPPAKNNGVKIARREVPPVAPGAGSAASGGNGGGGEVRLSQREAKSATDGTIVWNYDDPTGKGRFKKGDPIGVQEFARRKRDMQAQGVYDRVYVDG